MPAIRVSTIRRVAAAALVLWLGWPQRAAAQELCPDCKGSGRELRPLAADLEALEQGARYCSVLIEQDEATLGLGWRPCPNCREPAAKAAAVAEWEPLVAERRAWLAARRADVDERVGQAVDHVLGAHFQFAFDLPKLKVDKRVLKRHEAMHLYLGRLEELRARIHAQFGMTEADTNGVLIQVYLFERRKTAMALAPLVTDRPLTKGSRVSKLGDPSVLVGFDDPDIVHDDATRHQFLAHSVSHHVHDGIAGRAHWTYQRYGWVYEGLAHSLEIEWFGPPLTWCAAEGGEFQHWGSRNWANNVRKGVLAGDDPPFQELILKSAGALDPREIQFAWSYVDYLIALDPQKILPMLKLMTGPQAEVRDVLRDVYGLTMGQFVDGWREYVKKEYLKKAAKMKEGSGVRSRKG